jgi:hypothetical protein
MMLDHTGREISSEVIAISPATLGRDMDMELDAIETMTADELRDKCMELLAELATAQGVAEQYVALQSIACGELGIDRVAMNTRTARWLAEHGRN